jgi:hypothetical protein
MKNKTMKFLFRQMLGPEFWLLVVIGVLIYYLFMWRMSLRERILCMAGEFAKGAMRHAI